MVWPWAFPSTASECEAGFRLAVLFSELVCVQSGGRELLWPSVLLWHLRIGGRVRGTSRLSVPASLSPQHTLPFLSTHTAKTSYNFNPYTSKSWSDISVWEKHFAYMIGLFKYTSWDHKLKPASVLSPSSFLSSISLLSCLLLPPSLLTSPLLH